MSWPAIYPGTCSECGGRIHVEDEIDWTDRKIEPASIRHADLSQCIDVTVPAGAPGDKLCLRCFATHPGEC